MDAEFFSSSTFSKTLGLSSALALLLAGCSGDDTVSTASDTASSTGTVTASTTDSTTDSTTTSTTNSTTTDNSGTATMGETGTTTTTSETSTTNPTTTDTTTDPTTGSTTEPVTTTEDPTTGTTGPDCLCQPGDISDECLDGDQQVCADDCLEWLPQPCGVGSTCQDGACIDLLCVPNQTYCFDDNNTQACAGDGMAFDDPVPCGGTEGCYNGECLQLCDLIQNSPSSIGCSFIANRMDNYYANNNDSVVVGNTSADKTANVQLYFVANGQNNEAAQGAPVAIPPGGTHTFTLTNPPPESVSQLRIGGAYRVSSDIPVIAYQHSPIGQVYTNDASMLLPEYALKQNYVVSSWVDALSGYPSYFNVIAVEDGTKVDWTPKINTLAGSGVPAVNGGQTGSVMMNRFDTLQVRVANGQDISGTLVKADKPVWVVGATECTNVPNSSCLYCDHVEEQILPLDYWGKEYVGAHSPDRGNEKHHWRVYAAEANTTVTTEPAQPGTPIVLANPGDYKDIQIPNNTSFVFKSDKPFLPVQYLESQTCGAGTGDPAMYQMIPVEQFLSSYAFATGTGNYPLNYAQIIRQAGGADVTVDGQTVTGYYTVGAYEVADWKINVGSHYAESADPFGIVSVGYSNATSYAYPGGLRLVVINPQ